MQLKKWRLLGEDPTEKWVEKRVGKLERVESTVIRTPFLWRLKTCTEIETSIFLTIQSKEYTVSCTSFHDNIIHHI